MAEIEFLVDNVGNKLPVSIGNYVYRVDCAPLYITLRYLGRVKEVEQDVGNEAITYIWCNGSTGVPDDYFDRTKDKLKILNSNFGVFEAEDTYNNLFYTFICYKEMSFEDIAREVAERKLIPNIDIKYLSTVDTIDSDYTRYLSQEELTGDDYHSISIEKDTFLEKAGNSMKEKNRYYYNGPLYRFENLYRGEWEAYTEAVSEKQAINNLNQQAKEEFGFKPDAKLNIDPRYLELAEKEPSESDFDNVEPVRYCSVCGTRLNNAGECPVCDLGDEDVLYEAKHDLGPKYTKEAIKARNIVRQIAIDDVNNGTPLAPDDWVEFEYECKRRGIEPTKELYDETYTDALIAMANGYNVKMEKFDEDIGDKDSFIESVKEDNNLNYSRKDIGKIVRVNNRSEVYAGYLCQVVEIKDSEPFDGNSIYSLKLLEKPNGKKYNGEFYINLYARKLELVEEDKFIEGWKTITSNHITPGNYAYDQDDVIVEDIEKHDTLNQKLFDGEELRPEVKETIENIAKEFISQLNDDGIKFDLKDIVLIGSNVSYNYNKDSDLDIHLIADSSNLTCPDNLYPLLYSAYRSIFNKSYDITIRGIPAEIYVEMDKPQAKSNGIYSLNNGWVKKPVQQNIPELDKEAFDKLFNEWEDKYFKLIGGNHNG